MPAIHVRNISESLLAALRERAARRGHSMQQEILNVLEAAAAEPAAGSALPPVQLITVKTPARSSWKREDIYDDEGR
jgi:hypothetical protein